MMIFKKKEAQKERVEIVNNDQLAEFWSNTDLMIKQTLWLSGEHHKLFNQLSNKMEHVLSHGEDNVASVEEINAAINELNQMAQVSQTMIETLTTNTLAFQEAFEKTKTIFSSIETLNSEVNNATANAKESNQSLQDATDKIDTVIEYIRKVTKETHLLALNASIEAARAGEHGRGFAVVANEINKLSGETDKATGEIETIIKDIKEKNLSLNDKINIIDDKQEKLKSEVTQSQQVYKEADLVFTDIQKTIESINNQVTTQNATTKDINLAIGNVATNVTETHETIITSLALTESLSTKNHELNDVYNQLKVTSENARATLVKDGHNKHVIGINPFTSPLRIKELYGDIINTVFNGNAILYVPSTYDGITEGLNSGLIDLAWLSPFAYVKTNAACDIHPLVSPKVNNKASYIGLVITKTLNHYSEIEGPFGFVDKNSASGYIYAKAFLEENGIGHEPVFFGSHDKVIEAVLNGTVSAGATYNEALEFYNGSTTSLSTLYETEPIPKDAIVINNRSKKENLKKYKEHFLKYVNKNKANITGFIEITDNNYDVVKKVTK